MERLPPTVFGRTLRRLIRDAQGTQDHFAERAALSKYWVSKLVRGEPEHLTYSSLQKVLAGFARSRDREELYQAWLETYAPAPNQDLIPDASSTDEDIIKFSGSVHERIAAGEVLTTHQALGFLWEQLSNQGRHTHATLAVGEARIDTCNQLDRPAISLAVSQAMIEIARSQREPAWVARSLWLRAVSLRLVRPRRALTADEAFGWLNQYLDDWQPLSGSERTLRLDLAQASARDHVLSGLDLVGDEGADAECVQPRLVALHRMAGELEAGCALGLASEVLARASVTLGRFDEAEEHLRVARQHVRPGANQLKVLICQVQLLLADGQLPEAHRGLIKAMDYADELCLVHHRRKLADISQSINMAACKATAGEVA